jgi:alkanesulfonate monooxygenase SsuD/methylene tetrahydromethanopterin reductase-like flavin-dependent oxidoreductase (luciferase family)
MVEEFEAMNVPFESRGRMSTEEIEIFNALWEEEHSSYQGEFFQFEDIAFFPKPYQQPRTPLWLGGEGRPAQRRAAKYGDSWFPYFVRITPAELQSRYDYVRSQAAELGRDPDAVALNACLPIEVTPEPVEQAEDSLRGTPEQLVEAIARFGKIGVGTLALQFMVPRYPDRVEQIERFAGEALPELTA